MAYKDKPLYVCLACHELEMEVFSSTRRADLTAHLKSEHKNISKTRYKDILMRVKGVYYLCTDCKITQVFPRMNGVCPVCAYRDKLKEIISLFRRVFRKRVTRRHDTFIKEIKKLNKEVERSEKQGAKTLEMLDKYIKEIGGD